MPRRLPVSRLVGVLALVGALLASGWAVAPGFGPAGAPPLRVAVIGDYGSAGQPEADVAALVASWDPDFVITTGDNNYVAGAAATIDANIGQYYHAYINPYVGSYGAGASENRFFPSLGNHDWVTAGAQPYLDYFALPGNERYYQFTWGPLALFAIDSDEHEPDGIVVTSTQALWLQAALAASTAPWQLVYMHHPPYSSGLHGSTAALQWPYGAWGADVVLSGHDHHYERIRRDGLLYFVVGTGGRSLYPINPYQPAPGSQFTYTSDYGALLIEATEAELAFSFMRRDGALIDAYTLEGPVFQTHLPVLRR